MTLYLDTEFNGFGGELISLALVSNKGDMFYGVLELPENVHPWVQEHVVPILDRNPESFEVFRLRLAMYLVKHRGEKIIADWPEDLAHLLKCMCAPGGVSFIHELKLELVRSGELTPMIPHNALSDAQALMRWHQSTIKNQ